ncbi:MAG: tetratricopeptide repeat protein [Chitinophagaceae bacterium]
MRYLSSCYIILFLLLTAILCRSQELMNIDSLRKVLASAKDDTAKVLLYINVGQQYENNLPDSAIYYYKKANELSEKLNYIVGVIKYVSNITYVYNVQGKLDSALTLNLYSVELCKKINDKRRLGFCLANAAISYMKLEQYENSVNYYLQAIKVLEEISNKEQLHILYNDLAILYGKMQQYERAVQYAKQAIRESRLLNDTTNLGNALGTIAVPLISMNKPIEALPYLEEALKISTAINDVYLQESLLLDLGTAYKMTNQTAKHKSVAEEALQLSRKLDDKEGISDSYRLLSDYYMNILQFDKAKENALSALQVAVQSAQLENEKKALLSLSDISLGLHNIHDYNEYRMKQDSIDLVLLNRQITRNTQELEKKYETEKKNLQIQQLEKDKQIQALSIRQKNILNYVLIGTAVTLLIIGLLAYRTYRQRQLLQQRRILQLENEKQLLATEALLKGQEDERTRLAKDLHDGLGGMLSGIKHSLNTMKGNMIMTEENVYAFERSIDMLDASIQEMRRVAHNLMPESLVKFGLDTALKDFCNDVNQSGAVKIAYQALGMSNTIIEQATAAAVYRVVQELVNNILKYAIAKQAIVQVTAEPAKLTVTVEDDGRGFDTGILEKTTGIGWSNIRSRIDYLKGKVDIRSHAGEGTSVHIEIPI